MKKLRFFDSLKFMLATVACVFAIVPAHTATLPAGYTELEYLESTGEQYVELSFGFDPTDMILADFSVNIEEYSDKYMVAPKVWNSNHNKFAMGVHQGTYTIAYQDIATSKTALIPSKRNDGQIHKWIYGGYVFSIPELNTSRDVSDITFGTTTSNIRLFYGYNGGTKGKISYYKHVKANGTSVELIPARRDSDGVLGMYDLADANPATAFHTNAGTGEFVAGEYQIKIATTRYNEEQFAPVQNRLSDAMDAVDTVVTQTMAQAQAIDQIATTKQTRPDEGCPAKYCLLVEDEDGTPHWYPIAGANGVEYVLPAAYTELQYLQIDGESWIDTGIVATNWNWSAQFEMSVPKAGDYFFGAGSGMWSSTVWGAQFGLADSYGHSFWGKGGTGMNAVISNLDVTTNTFYNYKITKDGLYINDVLKSNNLAGESFSNSDLSLWIGKTNNDKTTSSYNKSSSSWRYVKIYNDNNKLVFNGIPARRDSDGVLGMYDLADPNPSTAFHTNAGTGEFVAGPDM